MKNYSIFSRNYLLYDVNTYEDLRIYLNYFCDIESNSIDSENLIKEAKTIDKYFDEHPDYADSYMNNMLNYSSSILCSAFIYKKILFSLKEYILSKNKSCIKYYITKYKLYVKEFNKNSEDFLYYLNEEMNASNVIYLYLLIENKKDLDYYFINYLDQEIIYLNQTIKRCNKYNGLLMFKHYKHLINKQNKEN